MEGVARLTAALHLVELLLPPARELWRGEQVIAQHGDEADGLVGGAKLLALAFHVFAVDEALDDVGAGGGGAQATILHRLGGLVVVHQFAGGLHRLKEAAFVVSRRGLGGLGQHLGAGTGEALPHGHRRKGVVVSLLLAIFVGHALGLLLHAVAPHGVNGVPARVNNDGAAAAEGVPRNIGDDGGALELGRRQEYREETPGHHVVNAACVIRQSREVVICVGGDDGVVVGDLGVVDHASEWQ